MKVMRLHDRGLSELKFLNFAGFYRDNPTLALQNAFDN